MQKFTRNTKALSLTCLLSLISCATHQGIEFRISIDRATYDVGTVKRAFYLEKDKTLILMTGGILRLLGEACQFSAPLDTLNTPHYFMSSECSVTVSPAETCIENLQLQDYLSGNTLFVHGCAKTINPPPLMPAWSRDCSEEIEGTTLCRYDSGKFVLKERKSIWSNSAHKIILDRASWEPPGNLM